jgi:transcriptional regulator with XRE-family HTH domain
MVQTEGRRLLLKYYGAKGSMTQAALAATLGVTEPSLSAWKRGTSRPESHYRKALERLIGIPEGTWMTRRERAIANGCASPDATGEHPRFVLTKAG